jgi:hypothetical protein
LKDGGEGGGLKSALDLQTFANDSLDASADIGAVAILEDIIIWR